MLKKRYIICTLITVLTLTSCIKSSFPWREGQLVAQLYRQYKQEILLAYNDFKHDMVVDAQQGYNRAYFDNYRKQMIFTRSDENEYWINGVQMSTADDGITGYVSQVLINEHYQIGVEILNMTTDDFGSDIFDGTKTRIIDLQTKRSITVPGLLFNRNLIVGHYFYGPTFDDEGGRYFDMIDLRTMEHKREKRTQDVDTITFVYQQEDKLYAQVAGKKQTFLIDGLELIEVPNAYNDTLPVMDGTSILKNVGPFGSHEHWYIEETGIGEPISTIKFIQITEKNISTTWINLNRNNVIQIMDVANYGKNHIALFLTVEDENSELHALVTLFDLQGNEISTTEIEHLLDKKPGQFTYLDYVL